MADGKRLRRPERLRHRYTVAARVAAVAGLLMGLWPTVFAVTHGGIAALDDRQDLLAALIFAGIGAMVPWAVVRLVQYVHLRQVED